MKNLLILLFIPLFGVSQTYNEIMSISTEDSFLRVVIENEYEFDSSGDGWITYGFNIERDSINGNKSTKWGGWNKDWISNSSRSHGRFYFEFMRRTILGEFFGTEDDNSKNPYDLIVKDIKKNCKYEGTMRYNGITFVTYSSCKNQWFHGRIGFVVSEGRGLIRHFPNPNE